MAGNRDRRRWRRLSGMAGPPPHQLEPHDSGIGLIHRAGCRIPGQAFGRSPLLCAQRVDGGVGLAIASKTGEYDFYLIGCVVGGIYALWGAFTLILYLRAKRSLTGLAR